MHLPDFPFKSTIDNNSINNVASIYSIVDTPEGVSLLSLILDFTK
jgi:hypothetical protein